MKTNGTIRLSLLEVVLLLLVGLIGWAAFHAFQIVRQVNHAPAVFRASQAEYFRIAERLRPGVEEMNRTLHRFVNKNDAAEWIRFQRASLELKTWLNQEKETATKMKVMLLKPVSVTADAGTLLDQIDSAYTLYLTLAQKIYEQSGQSFDQQLVMARIEKLDERATELISLAGRAQAHGEALELFAQGSGEWFAWLHRLLLATVIALIGVATWLSVLIYRRIVAPLRLRLVESTSIIGRQQKLAHFGELAAGIAHEIRNPLTAINARLFTLQRSLRPGSTEYEDSVVIRDEIARLNRIVKDFLELARPAEPQFITVTAQPLLEEIANLLTPQYEKQSILIKLESIANVAFRADPQQVKQVLINLVQNAAESMPNGGEIRLRAHTGVQRLKGHHVPVLAIEVQDTGPGIPPSVQKRLFDPFFSTKKGGTGLGLSIAAHIIDQHGGAIQFQTHQGRGTTFGIVFPMHKPQS